MAVAKGKGKPRPLGMMNEGESKEDKRMLKLPKSFMKWNQGVLMISPVLSILFITDLITFRNDDFDQAILVTMFVLSVGTAFVPRWLGLEVK